MPHVIHTKLGEGRRIVLPADLCRECGINPGDTVVLESTPTGINVRSFQDVLKEVQSFFTSFAPGVSMVDELIQDRRAEAAKENND